jgi:L-lactate dehydrogenase complex protein LldE
MNSHWLLNRSSPPSYTQVSLPEAVSLFITCYNDTLFPETGKAVVRVLERLGHTVVFPAGQTCCGQMHWNTGYHREAVPLIRRFVDSSATPKPSCIPSSSCVAMMREHYLKWPSRSATSIHRRRRSPAAAGLGVLRVPRQQARRRPMSARTSRIASPTTPAATACAACTSAISRFAAARNVRGIQLVDLPSLDQCCGFGGTFAIKNAEVSSAMLADKVPPGAQHRRRGLHRLSTTPA